MKMTPINEWCEEIPLVNYSKKTFNVRSAAHGRFWLDSGKTNVDQTMPIHFNKLCHILLEKDIFREGIEGFVVFFFHTFELDY